MSTASQSPSASRDEIAATYGKLADEIKAIKAGGKKPDDKQIEQLKQLKQQLDGFTTAEKKEADAGKALRAELEDILLKRFFYVPSFEIYGGVGGLYDFGPPGCAIKQNLMDFWRQHFVEYEKMLEVSCAAMTPEIVLKTSGHVDRFTDFMVKDTKTGDCYRADKLVEDHIDKLLEDPKVTKETRDKLLATRTQAGAMKDKELGTVIDELKIVAPDTGNTLSAPFAFNLMFQTQIGPTGRFTGYLRPETAQGIFVNFKRLLECNQNRMPFAAAQIGLAFRNEIAPRSGLLRVREFPLAEIEHFVNPADKRHPKFKNHKDLVMSLLHRSDQTGEDKPRSMTLGDAVAKGVIDNETLGYFMARTQLFLVGCGIDPARLRFRQHKSDEMAHYAKDCWDAEIQSSYGWVECVGHADRAAYDLEMHTKVSKVELTAQEVFDKPRDVETVNLILDHAALGKTFGKGSQLITKHLKELPKEEILPLVEKVKKEPVEVKLCTGESFLIEAKYVKEVKIETKRVGSVKFIPSVIEPSFGLGRILYSLLEHSYKPRADKGEKRAVLSIPAHMAPTKCSLLPISAQDQFGPILDKLEHAFLHLNLSTKIDDSSAALGRRYARADEIGIPFAVTVDFQTVQDETVTLRERDSTQQIRINLHDVGLVVQSLVKHTLTWAQAYGKYPQVIRED